MADNTVEIELDGERQSVTLPSYATESTQEAIRNLIEKMSGTEFKNEKNTKKTAKAVEDLVNNDKKSAKTIKDALDNVSESMNEFGKNVKEGFNNTESNFVKGAQGIMGAITGVIKFATGVLVTGLTVTAGKVNQLGNVFNDLTKSGLQFNETQNGALRILTGMNTLGLSTEEAANFMMNNAGASRLLNDRLVANMREFQRLTVYGNKFGLTLVDSINMYGEEIGLRQMYLNLGRLGNQQQSIMNQGIADTVEKQVQYSQVLGVSVDAIQDFARSVLSNNGAFASALIRLPDAARNQMLKGATDFLSTMRALGGEVGGELGAATLEAATFGAIGFSDAAANFMTIMPSLAGTMNSAIQDFANNTFDGASIAEQFTEQLGNLSKTERDRIFVIARAGDETAKELAKAVIQFEQASEQLKKVNKDLDANEIQKGFNAFNTIIKRFGTIFDNVMNMLAQGFGEGVEGIGDNLDRLQQSVFNFLDKLLGVGRDASETGDNIIEFGKKLGEYAKNFIDYMTGLMDALSKSENPLGAVTQLLKDGLMAGSDMLVDALADLFKAVLLDPKVIAAILAAIAVWRGLGFAGGLFGGKFKGGWKGLLAALGIGGTGATLMNDGPDGGKGNKTKGQGTGKNTGTGTPTGTGTNANDSPDGDKGKKTKVQKPTTSSLGSKAANVGKGVVSKLALPLMAFFAIDEGIDSYQQKEGNFMEKTGAFLEGAVSNITFGLIGENTEGQALREETRKKQRIITAENMNAMLTQEGGVNLQDLETLRKGVSQMHTKDPGEIAIYTAAVMKYLDKHGADYGIVSKGGKGQYGSEENAQTFMDDNMIQLRNALNQLINIEKKNLKANKETASNS